MNSGRHTQFDGKERWEGRADYRRKNGRMGDMESDYCKRCDKRPKGITDIKYFPLLTTHTS